MCYTGDTPYSYTQGLASPDSNMSNTSSVGDEVETATVSEQNFIWVKIMTCQERARSTNRPRKRVHSDADSSRKSGTVLIELCIL